MMRFPYIILIGLAAVAVWILNGKYYQEELTLYGFAETKETEINLNFPVMVEKLNVLPGQYVEAGTVLLKAKRLNSNIRFEDQDMKISEINAKKQIWRSEQEGKLRTLESSYLQKIGKIETDIAAIRNKIAQQKELYKGLDHIDAGSELPANHPSMLKIAALEKDRENVERRYQLDLANLNSIIAKGTKDEDENIKRLKAEYQHYQDNKEIPVEITAPIDGLVHEDYLVKVEVGDQFTISSIKDVNQSYQGTVIGLGSRIVEIPARMRKVAEYKTYGREVMIRLPSESRFLQNEKLTLVATK